MGEPTAGQVGKAATFTGSEFADVAYSELVNTDKFTITIWAKRGSGTGHAAPYSARDIVITTRKDTFCILKITLSNFGQEMVLMHYYISASTSHNLNTWYQIALPMMEPPRKIWLNGAGGCNQ